MGCDIHMYRERRVYDKWESCDVWEIDDEGTEDERYNNNLWVRRSYMLFGFLCEGVRVDIKGAFPEKGIPSDASTEVARSYSQWDCDGHSHNYIQLTELINSCTNLLHRKILGDVSADVLRVAPEVKSLINKLFLQHEQEDSDNYRIIFWFDN